MEKMNMDDLGNVSGGFSHVSFGGGGVKVGLTLTVKPGDKLVDIIPKIPEEKYRNGVYKVLKEITDEFGQITEYKTLLYFLNPDNSLGGITVMGE